ncbi:PIN/TRAM domain-containing protein [Selenomonas sp. TAMA-11512]|uniref:PIN/TRAM domain-containing protein n=1 Tax=Selenomonas sp. TAMA-11512 TaxID=3095337 RepID=UPI00308B96C6|nr:PIN/TRAM domain-containing protein [Selenomonas sp. TAMA-11512]
MLEKVLRFFITMVLAVAGAALMRLASPVLTDYITTEVLSLSLGEMKLTLAGILCIVVGALLGGAVGYAVTPVLTRWLKRFTIWVEGQLGKMPTSDVIAGVAGLAIGLIIANLLGAAFSNIPLVGAYLPVAFSIVFGYLGIHIVIKKQKDITGLIGSIPVRVRDMGRLRESKKNEPRTEKIYKVLDTSVIIDGRIADILETGFIDGIVLIPDFVLDELQHIADSADSLKRVRGRRGLDILQRIQTMKGITVEITDRDFEDVPEVDTKLVRLAQELGGKLITNDYNLNKVSELRGVSVLNINELSNAVKPVVIPGESMRVTVVKEGKEHGQGIAYLDDGTMIVIENGRRLMNETVDVEVTSALQTAAGRMIFAKPKA